MKNNKCKLYHYVYKLIDPVTGEYYFGSRTSKNKPKLDVNYMGSYITWKPKNSKRLIKIILNTKFKNRDLALSAEAKLIEAHINDTLCKNNHIPTKGYHCVNKVVVKDNNGNTFQIDKNDIRYLRGELKHYRTGLKTNEIKIAVKDKLGNIFKVRKDHPKYLNGEFKKFKYYNKNKNRRFRKIEDENQLIIVEDLNSNRFTVKRSDKRFIDGKLKFISILYVNAIKNNINRDILYKLYIKEKRTIEYICQIFKCKRRTITRLLSQFNILKNRTNIKTKV